MGKGREKSKGEEVNWREGQKNKNKATNVFLIIILLKTVFFFRPHEKKGKKRDRKLEQREKEEASIERETFLLLKFSLLRCVAV